MLLSSMLAVVPVLASDGFTYVGKFCPHKGMPQHPYPCCMRPQSSAEAPSSCCSNFRDKSRPTLHPQVFQISDHCRENKQCGCICKSRNLRIRAVVEQSGRTFCDVCVQHAQAAVTYSHSLIRLFETQLLTRCDWEKMRRCCSYLEGKEMPHRVWVPSQLGDGRNCRTSQNECPFIITTQNSICHSLVATLRHHNMSSP